MGEHQTEQELIQAMNNLVNPDLNPSDMTVVFVKNGKHEYGPIKREELKGYLKKYEVPSDWEAKSGLDDEWQLIYEHPFFQRRKPQLISTEKFELEQEIFVLKDGTKMGPYNPNEIRSLISEKHILITDIASWDMGKTWHKIYQIEEFDRRSLKQSELPSGPDWEVFKQSFEEVGASLNNPSESKVDTEAIAGLAYFEKVKSGKVRDEKFIASNEQAQESTPITYTSNDENEERNMPNWFSKINWKISGAVFAFTLSIYALYNVIYSIGDNSNEKLAFDKQASSTAPELKPSKRTPSSLGNKVNNTNPNRINKASSFNSPAPNRAPRSKSFTNTKAFRQRFGERKMHDNPLHDPDDYRYDNGNENVEQDPVREKISKETFDPEEDYYKDDSYQDEEIQPAQDNEESDQSWPGAKTKDLKVPVEESSDNEYFDAEVDY